MSADLSRGSGRIQVSPAAIIAIVSTAVLQCYGVVGIAATRTRHGQARILKEDQYQQGIGVSFEGGIVTVDVYVIVEYGTRISEVGHNIITTVGTAIRRSLGTTPIHVNVTVQGLRISA
jgi:uncharacterized alkaline shock family protein YloU